MKFRSDLRLLLIEAARANVLPLFLIGLLVSESIHSTEYPVGIESPMWIAEHPSPLVEPPHTDSGEPIPPGSHFDDQFQSGPSMPFFGGYDGAADVAIRRRPTAAYLVGFKTNNLLP